MLCWGGGGLPEKQTNKQTNALTNTETPAVDKRPSQKPTAPHRSKPLIDDTTAERIWPMVTDYVHSGIRAPASFPTPGNVKAGRPAEERAFPNGLNRRGGVSPPCTATTTVLVNLRQSKAKPVNVDHTFSQRLQYPSIGQLQ